MRKKLIRWAGLSAAVVAATAVTACGDDDASRAADAGTQASDATAPSPDAAAIDAGTDLDAGDAAPAAAAIVPETTTRMLGAINPYGLAFASDGSLYASGATVVDGDRKLAVWRYTNGALDTTFGTGGVLTLAIEGDESSFDIAEIGPGSFVVHAVAGGKVHLVKLTRDGSGAFTFGTPARVDFGAWADADPDWPGANPPAYGSWGIAVDRSDAATPKIVVFASGAPAKAAGGAAQRTDNDRWIARVLADTLAPDPAFNGGKAFSRDADGKGLGDNARRGIVLADGSIVSSGYTNFGPGLGNHVVLIRLTSAGTPDATFGAGSSASGETKLNPFLASSGFAEAYAVARQSTGRYVTTGYGTSNFEVASRSVDLVTLGLVPGSLDPTWGKLGAFAWQSENDKSAGLGAVPHTERGRDVAVLPDDRTLHFGVYDDFASVYVLAANGAPDRSSGAGGLLEYAYPAAFFRGVVSPDGKRIAASTQSITKTVDGGTVSEALLVTLKVAQ